MKTREDFHRSLLAVREANKLRGQAGVRFGQMLAGSRGVAVAKKLLAQEASNRWWNTKGERKPSNRR
jgi:hypothetical protein